jgi:acetyltransferase-like isoleucine patch superfamily enzyme
MSLLSRLTAQCFKLWNNQLEVGRGAKIDPRAFIARGGRVTLGESTVIRAGAMLLPSSGFIQIGNRSSVNHYTIINGEGGVEIGNSVMVAAFVSIFAANHNFDDPNVPILEQGTSTKGGVKIDDDVWIGTHAVILDGVNIGTGSVIAAGAVVTKDVPAYSVVMGVPGKVVRSRAHRPVRTSLGDSRYGRGGRAPIHFNAQPHE